VRHDGTAATVMLGLPGFVLLAVSEYDDQLEYAIETTERVTGCPECGVLARLQTGVAPMCGRAACGVPEVGERVTSADRRSAACRG